LLGEVRRQRFAVPALFVFHSGRAFALKRARQNRERSRRRLRRRQRVQNRRHVVPVDDGGLPSEGFEAGAVGLQVVLEHRGLALPLTVDVYQRDEVVQPVVAGEGGSFPHRAFRGLAIAHQTVDARGQPVPLERKRHPRRDR
jgi:hypothetical protein